MKNKKPSAKKVVTIVFIALIVLTVALAVAALVDDIIMRNRGMYQRTGLEILFYYVLALLTLFAVAVELNLMFDIRYFASKKDEKRTYKTVFHILGVVFLSAVTPCALILLGDYSQPFEIATVVFAMALAATRITHFIVFLVMHGKEKKDNNISKEIDTQ